MYARVLNDVEKLQQRVEGGYELICNMPGKFESMRRPTVVCSSLSGGTKTIYGTILQLGQCIFKLR
jgi:hypothetical protein